MQLIGKGSPTELGTLSVPTEEDLDALKKDEHAAGPMYPVHRAPTAGPFRPLMGRLTAGGFSLSRGKGFGMGFARLGSLLELGESQAAVRTSVGHLPVVLSRDITSRQYRYAQLSVLHSA
jgi:hypothetical protein